MPDMQGKTGRESSGRFKAGHSGNPKGRPPSISPELRQKLDDAAPAVIDKIIKSAESGDMTAARLVMDRIAPLKKPVAASVAIPELEQAESLSDKAKAVLTAVGRGECPPDIASTLIQAIASCARVIEIDELDRRLSALESSV